MEYNKTTKSDIVKIDPRIILFDDTNNPRKDYGDMESLIEFIRENGTEALPPIKVKKLPGAEEFYTLMHGYRRMTAINKLLSEGVEIARVKAVKVSQNYNEKDELLDHISENSGKKLTTIEEADVYKKLIGFGWSKAEIGKRIGKSAAHVGQVLSILDSGDAAKEAVNSGKIAPSTVSKLMSQNNQNAEKVDKIIQENIQKNPEKKISSSKVLKIKNSSYREKLDKAVEIIEDDESLDSAKIKYASDIFDTVIHTMDTTKNSEELAEKLIEFIKNGGINYVQF